MKMQDVTKLGVILTLTAHLLGVGACSSQPTVIDLLEGTWQMTTPDDEVVGVTVSWLQSGEYYLDAGTNPISGVYLVDGNAVVMVKPDNPRMKEFVWRRDSAHWLTLIEEPPIELSGQRLVSSDMVKTR